MRDGESERERERERERARERRSESESQREIDSRNSTRVHRSGNSAGQHVAAGEVLHGADVCISTECLGKLCSRT